MPTKRSPYAGFATAGLGVVMVLFPFLVLFAADSVGVWPLLVVLAVAAALRLYLQPAGQSIGALIAAQAAAVALIVGVGLFDANTATRLYPVAVNGAMLLVFGGSLLGAMPVIERLARLTDPELPPSGVAYCRTVTKVWCGFFVLNGTIALITAFWADRAVWALYNGFIAYVLMGCLFGAEFLVRRRIQHPVQHAAKGKM